MLTHLADNLYTFSFTAKILFMEIEEDRKEKIFKNKG